MNIHIFPHLRREHSEDELINVYKELNYYEWKSS